MTEEQMVTILREADERPVPEVAKKHGVSAQTIYGWRKHFGTLEPTDVKRLRQLEQENGRCVSPSLVWLTAAERRRRAELLAVRGEADARLQRVYVTAGVNEPVAQ